jgi:hypothetical protein|tara:strand:+ start:205 stop:909 length:705 start_codon:yes stop_codon:yes gene_type:complete
MTLNEIAYNILNLVRGGRSSNNEHISLDQIKFNVQYYRAMFIRRDFTRNGIITRSLEQDLGCLELEKVDASKCCNLPVECAVYKTIKKIPKTVRFSFRDAITHVSDVTGTGTIPLVESHTVQWLPYDKYTKDKYKAYMIEDYMYIYNANGLGFINVRGVFEDPKDVALFDCDSSDCYNDDMDYPLPADMLQMITQGILSTELVMLSGSMNDTTNDAAQDAGTPPQPSKAPAGGN